MARLRRVVRHGVVFVAVAAGCLPIAALVTIALLPLWSAIEDKWRIESVGHSGPAGWCYLSVYLVLTLGALTLTGRTLSDNRRQRSRPGGE